MTCSGTTRSGATDSAPWWRRCDLPAGAPSGRDALGDAAPRRGDALSPGVRPGGHLRGVQPAHGEGTERRHVLRAPATGRGGRGGMSPALPLPHRLLPLALLGLAPAAG